MKKRYRVRHIAEALEPRRLLSSPVVWSEDFRYDQTPHELLFGFDSDVGSSLQSSDVTITNVITGNQVDPETVSLAYASENNTAHLGVTTPNEFGMAQMLPDGSYEAVISGDRVSNSGGELLDGNGDGVNDNFVDADGNGHSDDHLFTFFVLSGDADRSRSVDGDDFTAIDNALPQHIGGWENGDFNLDGTVTLADYDIIDARYGTVLPLPPAQANALVTTASLGAGRIDLSWTPPGDTTGIDGYHIFMSLDDVHFFQEGEVLGVNNTSWYKDGLGEGVKASFRVRPFSYADGNGLTTNKAWSVTNLPGPGTVTVTAIAADALTLNWTDNGQGEGWYEILQQGGGVADRTIYVPAHGGAGAMSFRVEGLRAGTAYAFKVRAATDAQRSIYSPSVNATTLAASVAAPTDLSLDLSMPEQAWLQWTQHSDNESGFVIEASVNGGNYAPLGQVGADVVSYRLADLLPHTTYVFRVRAVAPGVQSDPSNTVTHTTAWFPTKPTNLVATLTQDTHVTLSWNDSDDEDQYVIYKSFDGSAFTQWGTAAADATQFAGSGLRAATQYFFKVVAVNDNGRSADSNVASVTTAASVAAPSDLVATAQDDQKIKLTWQDNSSDEIDFEIWWIDDNGDWTWLTGTGGAGATEKVIDRLTAGKTYAFKVRAVGSMDGAGGYYTSPWSNEASAKVYKIVPPSGFDAVAVSTSEINLNWTDRSTDEDGFEIQVSPDDDTHFFSLATVPPNACHFAVTQLAADQQYYFRIRAVKGADVSDWSSYATARTWDVPGDDHDTNAWVEDLGTVTPDVMHENTQWFGDNFEPGLYAVVWAGGETCYGAQLYGIGAHSYFIMNQGIEITAAIWPSDSLALAGLQNYGGYAFGHGGGRIGVKFYDSQYEDNKDGITWKLQRYHLPEPPPPPPELPRVSLSVNPDHAVATEGGDDYIDLVFSRAPLVSDGSKPSVNVQYTLAGTATPQEDYTGPGGGSGFAGIYNVTIPGGQDQKTVRITAKSDALVEGTESFVAMLRATGAYLFVGGGGAAATIEDSYQISKAELAFDSRSIKRDDGTWYGTTQWSDPDGTAHADAAPLSYKIGTTPHVTATFYVANATAGTYHIKGDGFGAFDLDFEGDATLSGGTLTALLTANAALPAQIDEEDLTIAWTITFNSKDTRYGTSSNRTYVTGGDAEGAFETVLDVGTRNAIGKVPGTPGGNQAIFASIWTDFADRSVMNVDGRVLRYWGRMFEQPTTVAEFLNEADGTCGSWADFLVATAAAQGVVGATAVGIVARVPNPPKPAQPEYTILAYQSLLVYRTLMGQGGKPVADKFLDHAVVEFGGRVYDPSYGRDYDTEVAWEDAAIEGYKFNWAKRVGADADLIPTYSDDVKGLQETAWE